MTKISNLKIKFSNNQLKPDFLSKTINIIFYNNLGNLISNPHGLKVKLINF